MNCPFKRFGLPLWFILKKFDYIYYYFKFQMIKWHIIDMNNEIAAMIVWKGYWIGWFQNLTLHQALELLCDVSAAAGSNIWFDKDYICYQKDCNDSLKLRCDTYNSYHHPPLPRTRRGWTSRLPAQTPPSSTQRLRQSV